MRKTKILATIGPASEDKIEGLVKAGVDGIRKNMSHVNQSEYAFLRDFLSRVRESYDNLFFVGDIQGPKIRLGDFESRNVKIGDKIRIVPCSEYYKDGIPIQYEGLYKHVSPGNLLLIDDGNVGLKVEDIKNKDILCVVEYGEIIEARKGVNFPNVSIPMDYLSDKDKRDLEFLVNNKFHYVSASYSRRADDIRQVRQFVGENILIIGKPENYEGDKNLKEIMEVVDAMMVPRGDYGMERGVENVPAFQKKLIEWCNVVGKPVITATQMLESMMYCKEPRRAEVSDVFNAVLDGSDVVTLSGETSKGKYPVDTVKVMNRVLEKAEEYLFDKRSGVDLGEKIDKLVKPESVTDVISKAVYVASKSNDIKAIIVPTNRGSTARMISRFRLEKPVIAVCHDEEVKRRMNAVWGVVPLLTENKDEKYVVEDSIKQAALDGYVKAGDRVVVTAGIGSYEKGYTNMFRIEKVN